MTSQSPLRFGILGAANIARQFATAVAPSANVRIVAIASRDAEKGRAFAQEIGGARVHSYEELLRDPEVDAVYVPLPNSLHAEWVIRAAEAGKHVLCEKPLAINAAEARAMFDAARKHGVHLVEAYPYRAQPQTLRVRELLAAGEIGRLRLIQASFGVPFADPANIRMDPALGGGALLDAGSYVASFVRMAAGEMPSRVHAIAHWADSGVDRTLVATLEYPSGLLAQMACSFATAFHRNALIVGDAGAIQTTFLNHPPVLGPPTIQLRRGTRAPLETIETEGGNGFLAEAESFRKLVADGPAHWTGATPQESIDIAVMLDAIVQSAKCRDWVTLA